MTHRFLPTLLRKALEKDIKKAREIAEDGATAAIARLGVAEATAPAHLTEDDKAARRRLRAHARALGDTKAVDGVHTVDRLVEAAAYAQWHRRLFARFLAERDLLRHPIHGVAVTLEDAEELAAEEGYVDGWSAAEAYAAKMLPAVFQPDDPVLDLALAPEHEQALRKLVLGLNAETFQTDDALGWTYQYWRALEKERVNEAGGKIGARELPAVTQLFTEPYMVQFLLHNTLGAWRAGKVLAMRPELAAEAADEAELRAAVSPPGYAFDMLRFVREGNDAPRWRPAAGAFPGWPVTAAAIRALDPCCGSGHFLTEILAILAALRADEEGLADAQAVAAVLRDNLFGLELDGRCVQIAAFAVALTAWRIGGFQPFGPEQVHIAWVGAPPPLDRSEFLALANGDGELRTGLAGLYDLFVQAPLLGSLIDPTGGDLMSPQRLGRIEPLLDRLVEKTRAAEPERAEGAVAARGMADAAAILSQQYTLVATNVPFLGRGKQHSDLAAYIERTDKDAKADLATAMLSRTLRLLDNGGTAVAVSPQNWFGLGSYSRFRQILLTSRIINAAFDLGPAAFQDMNWWAARTALTIITATRPQKDAAGWVFGAKDQKDTSEKPNLLVSSPVIYVVQSDQLGNPDHRIATEPVTRGILLSRYASAYQGIATADYDRFGRLFWEPNLPNSAWSYQAGTVSATTPFGGLQGVFWWEDGKGTLARSTQARIQGLAAISRMGVCVSQMRTVPVTRYMGTYFDNNCSAMVVHDEDHIPAVWSFCSSSEYGEAVRRIDQAAKVTNASLVKVPFDIDHWTAIAAQRFPSGLPEPYSDDPTQWLFHGHPAKAEAGTQLHVALARLTGYRWPAETDPDMNLSAEARAWITSVAALPEPDADGVLPLLAVAGERPLVDRLRDYLNVAVPRWDEAKLVREADERIDKKAGRDLSLEAWLDDRAFRQHSALFHNRPFLWHVWDGQKDGFSAFLHYHRLDYATLQKLTYTLLGAWIARREAEKDERRMEAAKILQKTLEAILVGEAPYDIFVRWKSLDQQPMGWKPDLDDGVRLNIRPWVESGILREPSPKGIKWGVDRGTDVASGPWFKDDKGKRDNDRHIPLAEKRDAREAATRKVGAA
jgi:hypothetical protein